MALSYVGGTSATGTGASYTVDLTALTGGSGSAPQTGDLVIVSTGWTGISDQNPGITSPTDYYELADQYSNSTRDANLSVSYKFMGPTPDTSVTVSGPNSASYGGATVVEVWRGVDLLMPFDTIPFLVTGGGSSRPNPGSVTPVTTGALVVVCGLGTGTSTQTAFTIPSATNPIVVVGNGSSADVVVGMGYYSWTSGAYDPAAFTGGTTSLSDSWCATTLALRPAVDNPPFTTLTTPADTYSTSDGAILFDITGTDIEGDPVDFNLQVDTANTFNAKGPKIADDFDNGVIDTDVWSNWGSSYTSESGGLLHIDIPANGGANWGGMNLNDRQDIRGTITKVELVTPGFSGQPSGSAFTVIPIKMTSTDPSNEFYMCFLLEMSGATVQLKVRRKLQNIQTDHGTVTFNATNHRWFRIREDDGNVFFETAPAAQTPWTQIWEFSHGELADIDLSSLKIEIATNCWTAITTPTGSEFDNFTHGGVPYQDMFSFWDRMSFYNPDNAADTRPFTSGDNIKVALVEHSYEDSNVTVYGNFTSTVTEVGQSFRAINGLNLSKVKFFLKKTGSPTGNIYAKLYHHPPAGYGVDAIPEGSALVTSSAVDINTGVSTTAGWVEFTFPTQYFLGYDNCYFVTVSYTGSTGSAYLQLGNDDTSPVSGGTLVYKDNGVWTADATSDCAFCVYATFDPGTYYWRVRATDPAVIDGGTGGAKIGPWSEVRSFTITGTPRVFPKVMTLGDSVTVGVGKTDHFGFRGALQYLLGVDKFAFVGGGSDPDFDEALDYYHDGRNGERTDEIEARTAAALDANMTSAPAGSWVLLHAGTNDINQEYAGGTSAYVQNISDIIDLITTHDASLNICVALILPTQNSTYETVTQTYNSDLLTMLQTKQQTNNNLFIADMHTKFTNNANWATEWMYDTVHPNDTGYDKMAEVWYDAMTIRTKDNAVKANIGSSGGGPATYTQANSAKASIINTQTKATSAKASIVVQNQFPLSVKAALRVINIANVNSVKSSIKITPTDINSAKANVRFTSQKAQDITANIAVILTQLNSTKANIKTTYYTGCTYDWNPSYLERQNRGYQS